MSGECESCSDHCLDCECDKKWLCASCYKEAFKIGDDFDWRTVGIVYFRCHKCGDDPVIFGYDDVIECYKEFESDTNQDNIEET